MLNEQKLDLELVKRVLAYDRHSGCLTWLARPREMFENEGEFKRWNSRYAGKEAITSQSPKGHKLGTIFGVYILAHRVVWALNYGQWPTGQIDHINGNGWDNRLENLRVVTARGNSRNRPIRSDNKSGINGVRLNGRKWVAAINGNRKTIHLGTFEHMADAILARKKAEVAHGYHKNHGRLSAKAGSN
jgi:hypothetical protein